MRGKLLGMLIVVLSLFCVPSEGKTQLPKTVVDFYLLLPDKVLAQGGVAKYPKKMRLSLLKEFGSTTDIPHGYMQQRGECECVGTLTVCLFRKLNGSYLVATHYTGGEEGQPSLDFFEFRSNHLIKVNPSLPRAYKITGHYELPRIGTAIRVNDEDGNLLYKLQWNRRYFVLDRNQRAVARNH